jgi:hypothetical protein
MQIVEVTDRRTLNQFHELPYKIYKNDPNWVPPLRSMHETIFDPRKNSGFKNGNACRWIAKKEKCIVGRIAAFSEESMARTYEQPTGCIGFFECIDDQKVADLLFDTAREWLRKRGMEAMDGPVNFGENFFHWGLLAEGYTQQTFGMQYHPTYYQKLFKEYGFGVYYKQFSYRMDITHPDLPERFWKIAAWVAKKPGLSFEHFTFKKQNQYIDDFMTIHRQAWMNHGNYKPATRQGLKELIKQSRFVLDEEFIWYAYNHGEPIAFFMMLPDVNQILKKLNAQKIGLQQMIRFMWLKKHKTITRCRVIVLGVIPKYQRSGIESGIFHQLKQVMLRKPWYNEMEMSWVGDFNPRMNALFKSLGADHNITHYTMRYLFDREKPFVRMPVIEDEQTPHS